MALALLIWQQPNLLLLDEPTNHLDLEMRQALSLALQEHLLRQAELKQKIELLEGDWLAAHAALEKE